MLLNYARLYQQIFELMPHERPDDDLLNNDDELDKWWTNLIDDRSRKLAKQYAQATGNHRAAAMANTSFQVPNFQPT